MHAITSDAVIVGVDTHKDVHVAVAITGLGARLGALSAPATADGYRHWRHGPPATAPCRPSGSRAQAPTVQA